MRNLLAGLLGSIIGAIVIVVLLNLAQPAYPSPYDTIWFLFEGSSALQSTVQGLFDLNTISAYIITWLVIGVCISPLSRRGWNTVRSVVWIGIIQGIFALVSLLFYNPGFWELPTRNFSLVYQFSTSLVVSLLALLSAYPLSILIQRVRRQSETPIPDKIETRCVCGAVFKSNPIICSECGAVLRDEKD